MLPNAHRRRKGGRPSQERNTSNVVVRRGKESGTSTPTKSSTPLSTSNGIPMKIDISLSEDQERYLLKSNGHRGGGGGRSYTRVHKQSTKRTSASGNAILNATSRPTSCWESTGLNFIFPALAVWSTILVLFWWPELKDNALDYYYLQYPEEQPMSPIPGTVLPLVPNVWMYDADKNGNDKDTKREVQLHLKEHKQPHYYMLPQDYYDQQAPFAEYANFTTADEEAEEGNTALEAPPIRGILIVLHNCHQSGLHFFQLPESRIVAAHALQRGLAIFSPTASSASALLTTGGGANTPGSNNNNNNNNKKNKKDNKKKAENSASAKDQANAHSPDKNCWSTSLDGDELLGPLLYEWAREMDILSLPRMAMGISNGANLLISSSLYKTMRLQSMALYASHHKDGFHLADLDRDVIPATAFVVFPQNTKATEHAMKNYNTLLQHTQQNQEDNGMQKEEEELEDEHLDDKDDSSEQQHSRAKSFKKTQLWKADPHPWTVTLCQERLPEYHTRCRSFFRHIVKYQKSKQRKQELKDMKKDPQKRIKQLRLSTSGGNKNAKQKFQLIDSGTGEVLQSSKSPQWIPVMESLGLDDWTTHTMAFALASSYYSDGNDSHKKGSNKQQQMKKRNKQKKTQLMQFPTTATPEGRSWLWASMLQEIEVAYGVQEMTAEYSRRVLDFLMFHAGLPITTTKVVSTPL